MSAHMMQSSRGSGAEDGNGRGGSGGSGGREGVAYDSMGDVIMGDGGVPNHEHRYSVTKEVIQNLKLARSIGNKGSAIDAGLLSPRYNSVDFHNSEQLLVAADDSDALGMFDIAEGKKRSDKLMSVKYGLRNVTCVRSSHHVLHSSRPTPEKSDIIRYWSLHQNSYVRYFELHRQPVTSICVAPDSDEFMSASRDRTVIVWDLRKKGAVALLPETETTPYAAYDHQGLVAAIATQDKIRLFDVRQWGGGPFITFKNTTSKPCSCLRFSNDGGKMLCVGGSKISVLDAIVGTELYSMTNGCTQRGQSPPEACFDPSSTFVLSGCADGYIRVWSAPGGKASSTCGEGQSIATLPNTHGSVPSVLKWAPTCMLVASGAEDLFFWMADSEVFENQLNGGYN